MQIDRIDTTILRLLAGDARLSVAQVANAAGLSPSACSRRIAALESAGALAGYAARLGRRALGYRVTAIVDITLGTQKEEDLATFERAVGMIDGVTECVLVSGAQDYRLRILARDLDDYERLHREHLGRLPGVVTISSSFVLREVATRGVAEALFGAA